MNKKLVAEELLKVAKNLLSMEFDSQEALDKYLKDHPGADKSNHTVKKHEKSMTSKGAIKHTESANHDAAGFSHDFARDEHQKAATIHKGTDLGEYHKAATNAHSESNKAYNPINPKASWAHQHAAILADKIGEKSVSNKHLEMAEMHGSTSDPVLNSNRSDSATANKVTSITHANSGHAAHNTAHELHKKALSSSDTPAKNKSYHQAAADAHEASYNADKYHKNRANVEKAFNAHKDASEAANSAGLYDLADHHENLAEDYKKKMR